MLFKGGNDLLSEVRPFVADHPSEELVQLAGAIADKSTPEESASAAANAEIEVLRDRLQQLQTDQIAEIDRVRMAAKQEAAAEHVRSDAKLLEMLSSALNAARDNFTAYLQGTSQALAGQLACAALQRLVETRSDDEDWLLRVVARRLAELDAASVVAVVLPEHCRAVADQLAAPTGTTVVLDPALPMDAARIDLTMGGVPIRIKDGLARLLAALDLQDDANG